MLDTFLNTLKIIRGIFRNAHHWHIINFVWSAKRPLPIVGRVKHRPPETGYGENYVPVHVIPNRRVVRPAPGPRGGKSVLYLLNDPMSINNPIDTIKRICLEEFQQDVKDIINTTVITYFIPSPAMPQTPTLP